MKHIATYNIFLNIYWNWWRREVFSSSNDEESYSWDTMQTLSFDIKHIIINYLNKLLKSSCWKKLIMLNSIDFKKQDFNTLKNITSLINFQLLNQWRKVRVFFQIFDIILWKTPRIWQYILNIIHILCNTR